MNQSIFFLDRVILQSIDPEALSSAHENMSDDELCSFLGLNDKAELENEKERFQQGRWTYNKKFLYFQILHRIEKRIMGWCGYHTWYIQHDRAELGYELYHESDRGKGYMSELMPYVIEYGFKDMNLNRIEAMVGPTNIPSLKLLEASGFVKEGQMRSHYLRDGEYQDSLVFSLLRNEYLS